MTAKASRIVCPTMFIIGVFRKSTWGLSLVLAFALFLSAVQSGWNDSQASSDSTLRSSNPERVPQPTSPPPRHGEGIPGDIAYQPGVIVQTPFPSFGPSFGQGLPEPGFREAGFGAEDGKNGPEPEPLRPDRESTPGDTASINAAPAPRSGNGGKPRIDPGPILAALAVGPVMGCFVVR